MTYRLAFLTEAVQEEWKNLEPQDRRRFKKKIEKLLDNPRVPANALSGMPDCYKIKFKKPPLRLVYRIDDKDMVFDIVKIGRRDQDTYEAAKAALNRH